MRDRFVPNNLRDISLSLAGTEVIVLRRNEKDEFKCLADPYVHGPVKGKQL